MLQFPWCELFMTYRFPGVNLDFGR